MSRPQSGVDRIDVLQLGGVGAGVRGEAGGKTEMRAYYAEGPETKTPSFKIDTDGRVGA